MLWPRICSISCVLFVKKMPFPQLWPTGFTIQNTFGSLSISASKLPHSLGSMNVLGKKEKLVGPWISCIIKILLARKSFLVNSIDRGNWLTFQYFFKYQKSVALIEQVVHIKFQDLSSGQSSKPLSCKVYRTSLISVPELILK